MVGNKAQKAVAAALTGILTLGTAAPALAATWSQGKWTRLDGTYDTLYDLNGVRSIKSVDGKDRYDTMFDAVSFNEKGNWWGIGSMTFFVNINNDYRLIINKATRALQLVDLATYNTTYANDNNYNVVRQYDAGTQTLVEKIQADVDDNLLTDADLGTMGIGFTTNSDGSITVDFFDFTTTNEVSAVVIASGDNYPDALAANSLAGLYNAPIIITPKDGLTPESKALIAYYASRVQTGELKVFIVGGTGAVSAEVESDLQQVRNTWTKRIYGADRQATSLAVAKWERNVQAYAGTTGAWTDTVFITTGANYADALSASSVSYETGAPILLTDASGNLSEDQVSWLKEQRNRGIRNIVMVGGPGVLDYNGIEKAIGYNQDVIVPLWGANRYETSAKVASWSAARFGVQYRSVAVATGNNFPDALVGGAFIGVRDGILVLADDDNRVALDTVKDARVWRAGNGNIGDKREWLPEHGFILGGKSAVSEATEGFLNRYIQPNDLNTQTDPNA